MGPTCFEAVARRGISGSFLLFSDVFHAKLTMPATMVADTDDDGSRRHVEAATDSNEVVTLTVDGQKRPGQSGAVPASFWNLAELGSRTVLDVVRGEFVRPVIRRLDDETVVAPPLPRQTRHFLLTSDHELKQEMWFDASDMLVQFRAFAPDGSAVTYRLVLAD
jgi:hypothetical protein